MKILQRHPTNGTTQVKLETLDDVLICLRHLAPNPWYDDKEYKLRARIDNIANGLCYWIQNHLIPNDVEERKETLEYREVFMDFHNCNTLSPYNCDACNITSTVGELDIHHILPKLCYPEMANDPDNMILVHRDCHSRIHSVDYHIDN